MGPTQMTERLDIRRRVSRLTKPVSGPRKKTQDSWGTDAAVILLSHAEQVTLSGAMLRGQRARSPRRRQARGAGAPVPLPRAVDASPSRAGGLRRQGVTVAGEPDPGTAALIPAS